MPSSDLDHNYYTLGHRRRPSQQSNSSLPLHDADTFDQTPPATSPPHSSNTVLPASTYSRPRLHSPKRLSISTNLGSHNLNARRDPLEDSNSINEASPDPHDFYRQYHDPFANASGGLIGQESILVSPVEGMTTSGYRRKSSLSSVRPNGAASTHSPPPSRTNPPSSYRSSSISSNKDSPLSSTKSNPILSATTRQRQSLLKDLVNKFNQTPDQIPPFPSSKPGSRSASRTVSPASSAGTYTRSRTASASNPSGVGNFDKPDSGPSLSRKPQRRKPTGEDTDYHPSNSIHSRTRRKESLVGNNAYASHSLTNLSPTSQESTRKPLFGELVSANTASSNLGYGIPSQRRRRGSEGSMHSPNPMFLDAPSDISVGLSPSSPTAWYLGYTPNLEAVNANSPSSRITPSAHRRTRSDFAGNPSKPTNASSLGTHMAVISPPMDPASGDSSEATSKRNSQSRIPVSTRRHSCASDSGNSSASTRANSALGRYAISKNIPPKGTSALPKPAQRPVSPRRSARSPLTVTSPSRRDRDRDHGHTHHPEKSPLLKAYVTAPPPKKSPPLRSSRPRQSVSTASTSASRAKVVERLSSIQNQGSPGRDNRSSKQKPKRLPELGNVDFAARRRRIQQAFNKTVKENERKEEMAAERRRAQEKESREELEKAAQESEQDRTHPSNAVGNNGDLHEEATESGDDHDKFETPTEEFTPDDRQLSIDTTSVSRAQSENPEQEASRFDDQDSPTLGVSGNISTKVTYNQRATTPGSDAPPVSAVTADTTDTMETDGTTFDNESQTDLPRPHNLQRTILSQIMQMRESSPVSVTSSDVADDSVSERDDKESIQIMLRQTTYFDESFDQTGENMEEDGPREVFASEGPHDRSSMSSWTSSIRDRQSLDGPSPMERIDENSPPQPQKSGHLSTSTAETHRTPQPWSPATFTSPQTARSTLGGEAQNTINRVWEHYPDASFLSSETLQQILTQSPELARQGGWDPKRVTQLYLQELVRGKKSKSTAVPKPLNLKRKDMERDVEHALSQPEPSETPAKTKYTRKDAVSVHSRKSDEDADTESAPKSSLELDSDKIQHRASLNHRDDWEHTSPSIVDWMTFAAADSPIDDSQQGVGPTPPPKDVQGVPERDGTETPRITGLGPKLPEVQGIGEGLGIAIHVQSPQRTDSPTIPPPPVPNYSPPPPPTISTLDEKMEPTAPRTTSPSVYASQLPSSIFPSVTSPEMAPVPSTRTSEESSDQAIGLTPSAQTSGSSSKSQERPSLDSTDKKTSPTPEQRRLIKRRHVIKELIDTEHSFGRDMKVVDDIYKGTSSSCLDLSAEDVKILFGNSDQIVQFSMSFLDTLKQAAKTVYVMPKSQRYLSKRGRRSTGTSATGSTNTDDQSSVHGGELTDEEKDRKTSIGEAFKENLPKMEKVYAEYLKNHDAANKKLQNLQQNPKVAIWLKECRQWASDLTSAWDLDSLLVKPVQRVLKYPLLLTQLLEATPEDHPDFNALDLAVREMTGVSVRINEMKKRADLVEQVVSSRKRKESDVRLGLSKAFGRRTEKLKQNIGLSDMFEDKDYNAFNEKFGENFVQLRLVMRDVEIYSGEAQKFMDRFLAFVEAFEGYVEVGPSNYPELESKWRRFRMSVKEISVTALSEHTAAIRKSVMEPMLTLIKLHEGPQRIMQKRNKRLVDFARFKAIKDRGDKPDKKTTEQGEQFMALNVTLKEELPKLFSLTGRLMEACLNSFVQIQTTWLNVWHKKLSYAIDVHNVHPEIAQILDQWSGDYNITEAQVLTLGICNGSMLADAVNLVNFLTPSTTLNGDEISSPRRPSNRTISLNSEGSPIMPPEFNKRHSGSYTNSPKTESMTQHSNNSQQGIPFFPNGRIRATSAVSGRSPAAPGTPEASGQRSLSANTPSSSNVRPATSGGRSTEPSPQLPRLSIETPSFSHLNPDSPSILRPFSASTHFSTAQPQGPAVPSGAPYTSAARYSPAPRPYSGFFSSAMPMSDSPRVQTPTTAEDSGKKDFNVLFLAASVYEFNIDRARREAGYPYLTYVAGEIFDVIGEKGELWLAKNQDDPTNSVGWIWNKHFAKLAAQ